MDKIKIEYCLELALDQMIKAFPTLSKTTHWKNVLYEWQIMKKADQRQREEIAALKSHIKALEIANLAYSSRLTEKEDAPHRRNLILKQELHNLNKGLLGLKKQIFGKKKDIQTLLNVIRIYRSHTTTNDLDEIDSFIQSREIRLPKEPTL